MNSSKIKIYYVMGVSGSGKSTIGKLLAEKLAIPFFDGDDYHPEANIKKMAAGNPLNDDDRRGWLETLNNLAIDNTAEGVVIVCSALKQKYRDILTSTLLEKSSFIYLKGSYTEIWERLSKRDNHFMPAALLQSQFDTLEEPTTSTIVVSIKNSPEEIVNAIVKKK